ncbi:MAG: SDR family oxidoreductase [Microthrixaceae bacterium]
MTIPTPAPDLTAIVTGASSGIGEALALELAGRGYGVTLVARSADRLVALAERLRATGVRADALPCDLADRSARAELPGRVEALGLTAGIVVNNAGLSTMGPVSSADVDAELNMVEVDVAAVAHLCTMFVVPMVERGTGGILNVASTAAFQPLPGQAGYGAAKAFVLSYSRALREECGGQGVHVTALCPGPVETGFADAAGISREEAQDSLPGFMWESPEAVARCGVDGLAANRAVAIPGLANRVGAYAGYLTPRALLLPLLRRRHPRMT